MQLLILHLSFDRRWLTKQEIRDKPRRTSIAMEHISGTLLVGLAWCTPREIGN